MARRNRSAADSDTQTTEGHTPSSPSRPPIVAIYCRRTDAEDKILISAWATWQGAAAFLEYLIRDQEGEAKWLKHPTGRWTELGWSSGLRVTCRSDSLLEKLAEAETSWTLPAPFMSDIDQFLGDGPVVGADHERRPKERGADGEKKPRTPRAGKTAKPVGPKVPDGFVHIAELVPDVKPQHARAALRSLAWTKPEYGWWFAPGEQARVSKAIKGAIK